MKRFPVPRHLLADRLERSSSSVRVCLLMIVCLLSQAFAMPAALAQDGGASGSPAQNERLQISYAEAMDHARAWALALEVDAVALQAHDPPVKGKKKLAEILDLLLLFEPHVDDLSREEIRARAAQLAKQVRTPEYQNMLECPAPEFEANSLSYLRIYTLLDRLGLLEEVDHEQLRTAQPRFDAEMAQRGAWQRAMFARYYDELGLEKPEALVGATLAGGVVEERKPLAEYDLNAAYALTHEVFVAYDYGREKEQDLFDAEDLEYMKSILLPLQRLAVAKKGFDLMGEVVSCNTYLGNVEDQSYRDAIELILLGQNENGSWGDYEAHRPTFGDVLEAHAYLHTTLVCVAALVDVFER